MPSKRRNSYQSPNNHPIRQFGFSQKSPPSKKTAALPAHDTGKGASCFQLRWMEDTEATGPMARPPLQSCSNLRAKRPPAIPTWAIGPGMVGCYHDEE